MKLSVTLKRLLSLLRRLDITPRHAVVSVCFSLAAAALEGASLALLIPLLRGVVEQDFQFVLSLPLVAPLASFFSLPDDLSNRTIFLSLLLAVFLAAILKNIFRYFSSVQAAAVARLASHNLRRLVFNRYLTFGKVFFDQNSFGYLNQLLMNYTARVTEPIPQAQQSISTAFSLVVYIIIMVTISWPLTLLVLILFPLMNIALRWLIAKIRGASHLLTHSLNDLSKQAYNILSSIPLVKAYTNEAAEEAHFARLSRRVADLEFTLARGKVLILPIQESLILATILLIVAAMAALIAHGVVTPHTSLLVYFFVAMNAAGTYGSLYRLRGVVAEMSGAWSEIKRVFTDDDKFIVPDGHIPFPGLQQAIQLTNLHFAYPGGRQVLDGISITIPKGKIIAVVGMTGAGKSTLVNLLLRFYDAPPNAIFADGADLRQFSLASWRQHVAWVSQDVQLFNDTLRRNVQYGLPATSDEAITAALTQARLADFVRHLPHGLDTLLGDKGVKLSGGEKQRVSIARALLKNTEILILDEATSSLDSKTEQLIQEAIDAATRGKTTLVIAHRLSTIRHADVVYVLEGGRVVEQGTVSDLLATPGVFNSFWQAQKFY